VLNNQDVGGAQTGKASNYIISITRFLEYVNSLNELNFILLSVRSLAANYMPSIPSYRKIRGNHLNPASKLQSFIFYAGCSL